MNTRLVLALSFVVALGATLSWHARASAQRDEVIRVELREGSPTAERDIVWARPDGGRARVTCTGRWCALRGWFGGRGVYRIGLASSTQWRVRFSGREIGAEAVLGDTDPELLLISRARGLELVRAAADPALPDAGAHRTRLELWNRRDEVVRFPRVGVHADCSFERERPDGTWERGRTTWCTLDDFPAPAELAAGGRVRACDIGLFIDDPRVRVVVIVGEWAVARVGTLQVTRQDVAVFVPEE